MLPELTRFLLRLVPVRTLTTTVHVQVYLRLELVRKQHLTAHGPVHKLRLKVLLSQYPGNRFFQLLQDAQRFG